MTVNRTTLLDLPLPVTGTESGTWGDTTNNGLTQYLDIAIAGTLVLSTDADVTLTSTEGDSSATNIGATTAQYAILRWTATGSTTRNITALAQSKTYVVINATGGTQSIVLRGAGPTTGVTIISGEKAHCVWNGSDFVKISSSAAAGGSNTQVQYNSSGVLAGSSNMTFDGTSLTLGGNPTLSAGTANGVLYLNGSKVATSGSALVFDGSNLGLGVTPSAWGTTPKALQVGAVSSFVGAGLTFGTNVGYNYFTDNVSDKYIQTGFASAYNQRSGEHRWYTAPSGTAGNAITFSQAMTLDASGNLGIGTTSPGSFVGTVKLVVGSAATTTTPGAITVYSGTATYGGLYFADGTVGDQLYRGAVEYNHSTDALLLYSAGAERARIDASGNLGLGVTPSAWGATYKAMQLGVGGSVNGRTNTENQVALSANAFHNGTAWTYIASTTATQYQQAAGIHYWFTAPSGTAGNAISFTQAMTLTSGGNLGLGTTSPDISTYRTFVQDGTVASVLVQRVGGTEELAIYSDSGITQLNVASNPLTFATGGTERARITSGGNLLVGTTSSGTLNGRTVFSNGVGAASIGTAASSDTSAVDTGITINQNGQGGCLILVASRNTSSGTSTDAAVYIVRFYYDGNNAPTTTYVGGSSNFVTFGTSGSNTLTLTNAAGGNSTYAWFGNK